jgi:hypothetical protein
MANLRICVFSKFFDNLVEIDFAPVAVHLDQLAGH